MNIKNATIADIHELNDLFDQYRRFYEKPSELAKSESFLRTRIEHKESEIFIVRSDDGIAAGFVQLFPLFSSTRLARYWLLHDLFVHPDFRGQGYSKALIERAKELCRATEACGMYLETGVENHIGNQLYPSMGFQLMDSVNFYEWPTD